MSSPSGSLSIKRLFSVFQRIVLALEPAAAMLTLTLVPLNLVS